MTELQFVIILLVILVLGILMIIVAVTESEVAFGLGVLLILFTVLLTLVWGESNYERDFITQQIPIESEGATKKAMLLRDFEAGTKNHIYNARLVDNKINLYNRGFVLVAEGVKPGTDFVYVVQED